MRCVVRGDLPTSPEGEAVQFVRYQDAAPYLKERLGRYCSFCERWVASSLAVEHKQPKSRAPQLEQEWSNFLLACANCNSVKGARHFDAGQVIWPDEDDTFSAIEYLPSGRVRPRENLPADLSERSSNLLNLVGLDRAFGESPADHRWPDRLEVWRAAQQSAADLAAMPTAQMAAAIVETAVAKGGFSIWMSVFANEPSVRNALIARTPGTVFRHQENAQ